MNLRKLAIAGTIATGLILTGCSSSPTPPAADVASQNLSTLADDFKVDRKITLINGITDKALLTIEGKCSIKDSDGQLEVTCKTASNPDAFKKTFFRLSDNSTYLVEQIDGVPVDSFQYKIIIRPETLIPDLDLQTSGG